MSSNHVVVIRGLGGSRAADDDRPEEPGLRPGCVLLDRGIPNLIGFDPLLGVPVPVRVTAAARRVRHRRWAFAPPSWPEAYTVGGEPVAGQGRLGGQARGDRRDPARHRCTPIAGYRRRDLRRGGPSWAGRRSPAARVYARFAKRHR
ncbi:hypothetical protein [Micromonospora mirobrigensis]|uniref:Uncharacterized protein n=1 Tax=Micromonospora mirobrigensis TaxID=262898 RepID=A0A1C4YZU6_9ACTN|nr:hypothetical protein [Micromonospora mirobrigensis]SCF26157.1 hypothetical protein GA0070564_104553 [Micromonospora mirobrigensis]